MSANAVTLLDAAKRFDNTGKIAKLVEIMAQTNEILEDALWLRAICPQDTEPPSAPVCLPPHGVF